MSIKQKMILLFRSKEYNECLKTASLYWSVSDISVINEYRLYKFNQIWQDAYCDIPFYEKWKMEHSLPDCIKSLDELSKFPILTKKQIQENSSLFVRKSKKPDFYKMTGGSSGQPLRFGCSTEQYEAPVNQWIGRVRYNIYPGTRTFLLWGHHHLYGKGVKSYVNKFLRKIKDGVMNSYRVSAYDLSTEKMRLAAKKMIKFSPESIIGYSAAILAFCRINKNSHNEIAKLNIKCIVCSAGPLSEEEKKEISYFFNAPLCMEYGSVECGVMAYTNPNTSDYDIFWNTHIVEVQKDKYGYKNLVTNLTTQYFVLIRYDIGDYFEMSDTYNRFPLSVKTVIGRPSDIVILSNGISFWGNLIGDCVKQLNKILSSQLYIKTNSLEIHVIVSNPLTEEDVLFIKTRCYNIVPNLKNISLDIIEKEELYQTPSGKIPLIVCSNN